MTGITLPVMPAVCRNEGIMKWLLAFIAGGMLTTAGCVKKGLTADDCPPGKVISWSTGQCIDNPANVPR